MNFAERATLLKVTLLHGCFSLFLNGTNGTKSRKASHLYSSGKCFVIFNVVSKFYVDSFEVPAFPRKKFYFESSDFIGIFCA